jgi:ABC-type uncharacterized transport system ATPase component
MTNNKGEAIMAKKKRATSQPKGEVTEPQVEVTKEIENKRVDELARVIGKLTYGQCTVLKLALDRRLAITRARKR